MVSRGIEMRRRTGYNPPFSSLPASKPPIPTSQRCTEHIDSGNSHSPPESQKPRHRILWLKSPPPQSLPFLSLLSGCTPERIDCSHQFSRRTRPQRSLELDQEANPKSIPGKFDVEYVFDTGGYGDAEDVFTRSGKGA